MFYHNAYGLIISSEIKINSFSKSEKNLNPDVFIKYAVFELPQETKDNKDRVIYSYGKGVLFYWFDVGGFYLEEGKRVSIHITTETPRENYIEAILMGPVMGMLLYQRQQFHVFHSSVVSKPDGLGAVSFMATMGGGKSSMAVAMLRNGYSHVADDLLAVRFEKKQAIVQGGFPGMKLWEDSSGTLVENGENLPMMGDPGDYEKRFLDVNTNFMDGEQPLHSVFLLEFGDGPGPQIIPLSHKEALFFLIPHWYGALFRGNLLPILGRDRHFRECANLAGHTKIYRLIRPRSLERIDESVRLIDNFRKENPLEQH